MKTYYESLKHFNTLIQSLCRRPAMFVGKRDFNTAALFLIGYEAGRGDLLEQIGSPQQSFLSSFMHYLAEHHKVNKQMGWYSHIEMWAKERGTDPFDLLAVKFEEFVLSATPPLIQLAQQAE